MLTCEPCTYRFYKVELIVRYMHIFSFTVSTYICKHITCVCMCVHACVCPYGVSGVVALYANCKWHLKRSVEIKRKLGLLSDCNFQHSFIIRFTIGGASCARHNRGTTSIAINQSNQHLSSPLVPTYDSPCPLVYLQVHDSPLEAPLCSP